MVYLIVIIYYLGTGEIVPTPPSITAENTNNSKLGIKSQKLMLLRRGNHYYKNICYLYKFDSIFIPPWTMSSPLNILRGLAYSL